jgi:hypothetical protein
MNAHTPLDPAAVAAANAMMDRLRPLADTITNARGFRALLEDLHDRNLSGVQEPHVSTIRLIRAAVLRSAIASIMACVDREGRDRACVAQIIRMMEGMDLSVLSDRWPDAAFGAAELQRAKDEWTALVQTDEYRDCKALRDNAIAHTLMLPTPTVEYAAYYRLHDAAERLALRFSAIAGFGKPSFVEQQSGLTASAKTFWDTHWKGMGL